MNTMTISQEKEVFPQQLKLPGCYDWQQFKAMQSLFQQQSNIRISYLDGVIELMTLGEIQETIKSMIAILLGIYFWQKRIEFIPVGSATGESERQGVFFKPDESYYIGEKKENPDLAIEVNISSGSVRKLEKYKRFGIKEVWIWQENRFFLYALENDDYQQILRSRLLRI